MTLCSRLFQRWLPATGKAQWPTAMCCVHGIFYLPPTPYLKSFQQLCIVFFYCACFLSIQGPSVVLHITVFAVLLFCSLFSLVFTRDSLNVCVFFVSAGFRHTLCFKKPDPNKYCRNFIKICRILKIFCRHTFCSIAHRLPVKIETL